MTFNNTFKKRIEAELKKEGFKFTLTRKTILDIVSDKRDELTAEEIFILARRKNPKIGIATIYRTLGLLEDFNIIGRIRSEDNRSKYKFIDEHFNYIDESPSGKKVNQKNKNSIFLKTKTAINRKLFIKDPGVAEEDPEVTINMIQSQLDKWVMELNKIKKEKENKLEEMMNDFGKIDRLVEKHQSNKGNLIQILLDIQGEYNWLPKHVLLYVSNRLNVPLTQIYGIASFYKFFNLEPKGKYQITVCAGTACHVRGSMNLLQRIVNILKIKPGDTTSDLKFTLETVNCLGCCALGPVMHFNDKYHSNPSTRELKKMFSSV